MVHPLVLTVVAGGILAAGVACQWPAHRTIDAGFWFEHVTYTSPTLQGSVTAHDMKIIESVARSELAHAFDGLRIVFSDRRDARYRVQVVQTLRDSRFRRDVWVAGESRALRGFGGHGAVSFFFLASGATASAPEDAGRDSIVEAIGRGIGRTAVHEFVHQLLPTTPIHDSTDVQSYEYEFAGRREQYFGGMRWSLAWPLLHEQFGR
jgi:hypothetical protein